MNVAKERSSLFLTSLDFSAAYDTWPNTPVPHPPDILLVSFLPLWLLSLNHGFWHIVGTQQIFSNDWMLLSLFFTDSNFQPILKSNHLPTQVSISNHLLLWYTCSSWVTSSTPMGSASTYTLMIPKCIFSCIL